MINQKRKSLFGEGPHIRCLSRMWVIRDRTCTHAGFTKYDASYRQRSACPFFNVSLSLSLSLSPFVRLFMSPSLSLSLSLSGSDDLPPYEKARRGCSLPRRKRGRRPELSCSPAPSSSSSSSPPKRRRLQESHSKCVYDALF